ncbi:MAG: class I SAM-dependent methyltransferase [Nitrospirae bacterium]|nr:class I SAM-dependent methyltransferase [Nitrospirota bacterium]
MSKRMEESAWDLEHFDITKSEMNERIKMCSSYLGWKHTIRLITDKEIPFNKLKVAEVGCGTGTFSLILGLLGASITLIDFNQKVLEGAKKIYNLYDCKAEFIKADCLDVPPKEITGTFDLVISGGLAEHFIGEDREQCIRYHKLLLKDGGFAFIGVPNRFSPFYQGIRLFRKLSGTWSFDVEVPFSNMELKRIAKIVGFKEAYVIGNAPLRRDFLVYSRGFVSALVDIFPKGFSRKIRTWKTNIKVQKGLSSHTSEDMRKYCLDEAESIKQNIHNELPHILTNRFSAGLILFAFK